MPVRIIFGDNNQYRNMEYPCKPYPWDSGKNNSIFKKQASFILDKMYCRQKNVSEWNLHDDQEHQVFCINEGSLPTHIKTIKLGKNRGITIEYKKTSLYQRLHRKYCVMALLLLVIFVISLAVAMTVWFITRVDDSDGNTKQWPVTSEISNYEELNSTMGRSDSDESREVIVSTLPHHDDEDDTIDDTNRAKCKFRCREYSAFRFESACLRNHCVCYGNGYQRQTCLPSVNKCSIKKKRNSKTSVTLSNVTQTAYSCKARSRGSEEVHVLSCFGNGFNEETVVEVKETRDAKRPIVLVLANYQKMKWNIKVKSGSTITKIYLLSSKHLKSTEIVVNSEDPSSSTEIERLFSHTGYGEDKRGGRTVDMLNKVYNQIGDVTSFTGTSKADHWELKL